MSQEKNQPTRKESRETHLNRMWLRSINAEFLNLDESQALVLISLISDALEANPDMSLRHFRNVVFNVYSEEKEHYYQLRNLF